MDFSIPFVQRMYRLGALSVLFLVIMDLWAFFYFPDTLFAEIFVATQEQTPLTWVSVCALFLIALGCAAAYHKNHQRRWYFLAAAFVFFSIDDAIYLHERVSGFVYHDLAMFSGFPTYIWMILYFPLLATAFGGLFVLLWRASQKSARHKLLLAALLLGLAMGLDLLDGFVEKSDGLLFCLDVLCHASVEHMMRLVEEVSEVCAVGILGYFVLYVQRPAHYDEKYSYDTVVQLKSKS